MGTSSASSAPQAWRLAHEARAAGLDVTILYVGENDVAKCILFSDPVERELADFFFDGDVSHLELLHPWFLAHERDWLQVRARKLDVLRRYAVERYPKEAGRLLRDRNVYEWILADYESATFSHSSHVRLARVDPAGVR